VKILIRILLRLWVSPRAFYKNENYSDEDEQYGNILVPLGSIIQAAAAIITFLQDLMNYKGKGRVRG